MADNERLTALVLEAQSDIFRLARRDYGLSLAEISRKSNVPLSSVRSYAGNNGKPVAICVPVMLKLVGVIPDHLLSLLLNPVGKCLADADEVSE